MPHNNEKLRAVLDATPFPVALVDLQDDRIFFWSSSALALFGHTAPTASEWYQIAYPDPDYRCEVVKRWKPALEVARHQSPRAVNAGEYRIACGDGSERICELYAAFIGDYLVVTFNDITERKLAEESKERFRSVFECSAVGMALVGHDGRWVQVNKALCEMLGYSEQELLATNFQSLTHPDDLEADLSYAKKVFTGQIRFYHMEKRYIHKQGHVVWVTLTASAVLDASGQVSYGIAQVQDITARKNAEAALRESEARFRNVFQDAGVGMVIVSLEGWFLAVNRTFCEHLGYTEEELIRMTVKEVTQPEDWPLFSAKLQEAIATGTSFQRFEKRCRHKSGCTVYMETSASLIRTPDGKPQYFVGEVLNVTDRKMAEQSLADANRRLIDAQEEERARIARDLHDDVNQRLALLAIGIEQLRQGSAGSSAELDELVRQTDEISADIQSISHQLHPSKLEYLGMVSAIRSFCKESEEKQKVDIHFSNENVPATVPREVSICLFRVLQEALRNGIKHSGVRRFKVCLQGTPGGIRLRVSDSGVGFDIESVNSPRGLGLISMRERVRLVQGALSIETTPGGGTTIDAFAPITGVKVSSTTLPAMEPYNGSPQPLGQGIRSAVAPKSSKVLP